MINIISYLVLAYMALYALAVPVPNSGIMPRSTYEGGFSRKNFDASVKRQLHQIAVERCGPTAKC